MWHLCNFSLYWQLSTQYDGSMAWVKFSLNKYIPGVWYLTNLGVLINNSFCKLCVTISIFQTHYENGEYIIRQGARGDTFFIISKGTVSFGGTRCNVWRQPGVGQHSCRSTSAKCGAAWSFWQEPICNWFAK